MKTHQNIFHTLSFHGDYRKQLDTLCLSTFEAEMQLLQPQIIVALGRYVEGCIKKLKISPANTKILYLQHPSPIIPNNKNWPEHAEKFFIENSLLPYIRNEADY